MENDTRKKFIFLLRINILINLLLCACFIYGIIIIYPNKNDLDFDYIGIIIGILSLLVTILAILFGYNIFDFKNQISKNIDEKSKDLRNNIQNDIILNEIEHNYTLAEFYQKHERWNEVILICSRIATCYSRCENKNRISKLYQLIENAHITAKELDTYTIQELINELKELKEMEAFRQIQSLETILCKQIHDKNDTSSLLIFNCIKNHTGQNTYCYSKNGKQWGCKHLTTDIIKTKDEKTKAKLFSTVYREAKKKGIIDCPYFRALNLDEALE